MTQKQHAEQKFKQEAIKILSKFMPIRLDNVDYQLRLDIHYARLDELSNAIKDTNAPDVSSEFKDEVINWARNEYEAWIRTFHK